MKMCIRDRLDHCKRGTLDLSKVRYVVIDEADLMLDMGFIEDVRNILMHLEGKPVFMLFSATMGERLEALAAQFMHEPLEVKIENDTETADTIEQVGYFVDEDEKKMCIRDSSLPHHYQMIFLFWQMEVSCGVFSIICLAIFRCV